MEIKNETYISNDELGKMFLKQFTKMKPAAMLPLMILSVILTLVVMIMNILEVEGVSFGYVILSVVIPGLCNGLYLVSKRIGKNANTNMEEGVRYSYVFKDECFDVESDVKGQHSQSTIQYSSLYDVKDKGDFVMLYISKVQVYLCKYNGFTKDEKDLCLTKLSEYRRKRSRK